MDATVLVFVGSAIVVGAAFGLLRFGLTGMILGGLIGLLAAGGAVRILIM